MPDTVFVVIHSAYSYESSVDVPILVTFNEVRAQEKIAEMEARKKVRTEALHARNLHMIEWEGENPRPLNTIPKERSLPDYGRQRHKWSLEQVAEYNAIKLANQTARIEAIRPLQDWALARHAASSAFTLTFTEEVQADIVDLDDNSMWTIESVPYAE